MQGSDDPDPIHEAERVKWEDKLRSAKRGSDALKEQIRRMRITGEAMLASLITMSVLHGLSDENADRLEKMRKQWNEVSR